VALIGANGAGKSTFLKAIMGAIKVAPEMVALEGQPTGGVPPHRMVAKGVAIVPEGRRLFVGMTVEDNLRVAIDHASGRDGAGRSTASTACFRCSRRSGAIWCRAFPAVSSRWSRLRARC
jgi:ABC-type branched-subunit amino acid transport system ATPase component